MIPDATLITTGCFPTPLILIRSRTGAIPDQIEAFPGHQARQARQAQRLCRLLARHLLLASDTRQRSAIFTSVFASAELWRYQVAVTHPHADGRYSAPHAQRFRDFITDDNPNYFPIGEPEKYRDGARWDSDSRSYVGGDETPASQTMRRFAALAKARFAKLHGDLAVNEVMLPDGRSTLGTRLLRGDEAIRAANVIAERIAVRGGDGSRIARAIDGVYTASAPQAQRREVFHAAMAMLARRHDTEADASRSWLNAAYLLYQAPRRKRGTDATIRTFLVAAGLHLLGRPPTLPHDLDLLAYVHTQGRFTAEVGEVMGPPAA